MGRRAAGAAVMVVLGLALASCTGARPDEPQPPGREPAARQAASVEGAPGEITLAFAGDVHFEDHLARLLDRPRGALGPIAATLREADLAMLNLESAVTTRGRRDPKEFEDADRRYHFRAAPHALDVLASAGVDVVGVANNHVGDYGTVGLADTMRAARDAEVEVIGIGRDRAEALTPYRVTRDGIDVAFLAADSVFREGSSDVWAARPHNAGVAAARRARPAALLAAVRAAAEVDDVVVVYLHWGRERQPCPTQRQRLLGRRLAGAGADVVVGSHSHVLGGAGWSGDTYVGYGLANFVWYHDRQPDTGVLSLRVDRDGVIDDAWTPALIGPDGRPRPLSGAARAASLDRWTDLRRCTGLAERRGDPQAADPAYGSSGRAIGPALAERMRSSHRPGCPVPLRDLRHLRVTHRDFDGVARTGEMVVHRRYARDVARVFGRLYEVGFPIRRMRLVDEYDGGDDRSMAANNTSGYNCRRVAGQAGWSDHAYGAAIDINPIQNPHVRPGSIDPPSGRAFARVNRGGRAPVAPGVVQAADPVVAAFARIGWQWGGHWASSKDYQHFAAPDAPSLRR